MTTDLERGCVECGLRMSGKRRAILRVLEESQDHPSAEEVYRRLLESGEAVSVATVYRNMALLSRLGLLSRLELGDRKARYEKAEPKQGHEHLIDIDTGRVVEFCDQRIEALLSEVVADIGYHLVNYRISLFCSLQVSAKKAGRRPRGRRERAAKTISSPA
jgi:Fur family transcriptional regulator, ferric uptake regulator